MTNTTPFTLSIQALKLLIYCVTPILLANIMVGIFMAIVQAITHIQDSSLAFVPKAIATIGVLYIFYDRIIYAFHIFFYSLMSHISMC